MNNQNFNIYNNDDVDNLIILMIKLLICFGKKTKMKMFIYINIKTININLNLLYMFTP